MIEIANRQIDVIHDTTFVETPNSFINGGKAMFMEVSTITPQNDISPVATIAAKTLTGILSFDLSIFNYIQDISSNL